MGICQGHSMAKTAVIVVILRAILVMVRITGGFVIVVMLRMILQGGGHFTWIRRKRTGLQPGT